MVEKLKRYPNILQQTFTHLSLKAGLWIQPCRESFQTYTLSRISDIEKT